MEKKTKITLLSSIVAITIFSVLYYSNENNTQYFIIREAGVLLEVDTPINTNTSIIYQNDLKEMQNIEEVLGHEQSKMIQNIESLQRIERSIDSTINNLQNLMFPN